MPDPESPILPPLRPAGEVEHSTEPPIVREEDELAPPGEVERLVAKHEPSPPEPPAPPVPPKVIVHDAGGWWLWAGFGILAVSVTLSLWYLWRSRHAAPGEGRDPGSRSD